MTERRTKVEQPMSRSTPPTQEQSRTKARSCIHSAGRLGSLDSKGRVAAAAATFPLSKTGDPAGDPADQGSGCLSLLNALNTKSFSPMDLGDLRRAIKWLAEKSSLGESELSAFQKLVDRSDPLPFLRAMLHSYLFTVPKERHPSWQAEIERIVHGAT